MIKIKDTEGYFLSLLSAVHSDTPPVLVLCCTVPVYKPLCILYKLVLSYLLSRLLLVHSGDPDHVAPLVLYTVHSLSHTFRLQSSSRSLFLPRFMSLSIVAVYMPSATTFTCFFA
jgi:hypothetical protein